MSDDGKIIDLAGLTPLEYEKRRREEAKKLGVRMVVLDKVVHAERTKTEGKKGLQLTEPKPWPERVDGDALLDELVAAFHRYLALPDGAAEVLGELEAFRRKVTGAGRAAYGATAGAHDDLVIAVALAVWWAAHRGRTAGLVGPYRLARRDPRVARGFRRPNETPPHGR